ncbi:hypothetical protein HN873_019342 [Arachis hypogaea]|uniref:Disease resistance protein n=2 Tax=Arachis hypogaea TaxID=3818 RepID=A0A445CS24_ARAHY|nr:Disease resistance protein [Arachis hypogaea]RYR53769.1 hypothetical protein Ahy_A06g029005 isoform B [Arachis hypogaea]
MAESFIFNVAQSLIRKLASPAYEAATQLIGVYDDLQDFKHTFSYVKAVLLDAEQKQEQNHALREWLKQIKRVFSDAEIVLDELECEILRKQVVKAYGSTKHKVGRFFLSSNSLVFRYKMSKKLEEIKKRLDLVAADRNKFGLERIDVDRRVVHRREMTYSHVVESNAIGRDFDKENIIKLLLQENSHTSVIPIVGIGGMGKTTLAKLVHNDQRITESFPLKIWICVSDDFDINQLLIKIIMCASEGDLASSYSPVGQQNVKDLDVQQLQHTLRKKIAGKKFLLVLDDVWNDDRVKWLELQDLLEMMGSNESKILVTTRSPTIASMMGTVSSYNLEGLSLKNSLSLFVRWAFKEGEEKKYPKLMNIAKKIVKKCSGVPLAIRTLGSSLFSKHKIDEWEHVRDNEIWKLSQRENDILPVLKLSYDQMPSYLKHCFAMFSLFPKDYVFISATVSSLWGALGLIPSSVENKSLEDIANQYLLELMSKSFLQDFIDFGAGYCFKIHDLMHDLAIYVAKDQCVCVNLNIQNMPENVQHLSFLAKHMPDKSHIPESATLRTILFPVHEIGIDEAFLNTSVLKHKYLYMLDLSNSTYETLPWFIHKLKHLRFLDLQYNRKVKRLPDSICILQCLQTFLLVGCTELEVLPRDLEKLISLRRLEITTKQISLPEKEIAT